MVASSKVYGYESGKAQHTFEPRPSVGESGYRIESQAQAVARGKKWVQRISDTHSTREPAAFVAPIAAGEKVVADIRADVYRLLREDYGDALAVEMEGRGFLVAARAHSVEALVVRGISDLINGKGEADASGSQEIASRHAAAFGFEVLAHYQGPPSSGRRDEVHAGVQESDTLQSYSQQLLSWPQTLPDERWLERPELQELLRRIEQEPTSRTVVLGGAGSGKSALLARLGKQLEAREDVFLLAIKADRLDKEITTREALQHRYKLPTPLADFLKQKAQSRKVVVLMDQLDALAEHIDLQTNRLDVLIDLVAELGQTSGLHIIASCRPFDYRHDVRFKRYPTETLTLELPAWTDVEVALTAAGVDTS